MSDGKARRDFPLTKTVKIQVSPETLKKFFPRLNPNGLKARSLSFIIKPLKLDV